MSDTPRTDAAIKEANGIAALLAPFARTLERELNELKETQKRMILEAFPTTEEKVRWEQLIQERDQLKAELERKRNAALELSKSSDAWHDMARELKQALGNDGMLADNPLSALARDAALDRCDAMERLSR